MSGAEKMKDVIVQAFILGFVAGKGRATEAEIQKAVEASSAALITLLSHHMVPKGAGK